MLRLSRGRFGLGLATLRLAVVAASLAVIPAPQPPSAAVASTAAHSVEQASATLGNARNEKVRVQAALVLGRLGGPTVIPPLMRALADRSSLVRAVAARVLGDLEAASARDALEVAARDDSAYVRRHATMALQKLARASAQTNLQVNPMGDRTRRAPAVLREKMRKIVVGELSQFRGKPMAGNFAVDGAIRVLEISHGKIDVEVKCNVQLILSTRPGGSIVLMSSGEATVQRPRARSRSGMLMQMQIQMQSEALQGAVRAAAEQLRAHLSLSAPKTTADTPVDPVGSDAP